MLLSFSWTATYSCCHSIRVIMGIMYYVRLADIASVERPREVGASSNNESFAIWGICEVSFARRFWNFGSAQYVSTDSETDGLAEPQTEAFRAY